MKTRSFCLAVVILVTAWCVPAFAWTGQGHQLAARAAVMACAQQMPPFFSAGIDQIVHCSLEPDAWTRPLAPEALHAGESSEHYFDLELLKGLPLPARRDEYLRLCAANGIDPTRVGFLPYAIVEWTGRLTVALAEHRRWPDNPHIQAKVLVYAGILAHYTADLQQPLHVTIHWDGRAGEDGQSPRTGIHLKVDALGSKLDVKPEVLAAFVRLASDPTDDPWSLVRQRLEQSANLVDAVYSMESQLPDKDGQLEPGSKPHDFAERQLKRAADTTATLYLTAWRDSKALSESMPDWHVAERELQSRKWMTGAEYEAGVPTSAPASQPAVPAAQPQ